MANGVDGPIGEMTESMWNAIKILTWLNGGWKSGGVTKWLHPARNGVDFKNWFALTETSGKLLKLWMDEADFNTLKGWTFDAQNKWWYDAHHYYRLKWEYVSADSKFKALIYMLP